MAYVNTTIKKREAISKFQMGAGPSLVRSLHSQHAELRWRHPDILTLRHRVQMEGLAC